MSIIENRTYDEIEIGNTAEIIRTLGAQDIAAFAAVSGDVNPAHVDSEFAENDRFHKVIAHGMWGGALISAVLGTELPGPGTIYVDQSLQFHQPVSVGDTITARVTVTEKNGKGRVRLDCHCINQRGEEVISGTADVIAPREKVKRERVVMPTLKLQRHRTVFSAMLASAASMAPLRTAVVHPVDEASLLGAVEARAAGLIEPILVGPTAKIDAAAATAGIDISGMERIATEHSHAAAQEAVRLVRSGGAEAIMKGALHTDELMAAVMAPEGLRTDRRVSHVFMIDVPSYPKPLFITDAAINIEPNLADKADIIRNAIGLCHALGIAKPKVAILAAIETVNPGMRSTVDAAALCKMADRGQISGAIVDGPLAFDNAISSAAADIKHIVSDVAGDADILVAPDLEAGNMIAKQLIYLSAADAAGIVLGARAPIILTSRSDSEAVRVASAALALLYVRNRAKSLMTLP